MNQNIILDTDSYKVSMFKQYPPGTEYVYSYIEARGGIYDSTLFFGLQMFVQEYLAKPITTEMIDEAEEYWLDHMGIFNREGWEYILNAHGGYLPLEVRAVPEGTVVPVGLPLVTVVNTDPKCFWLTTYMETALLRAVWYPTTVATRSFRAKRIIKKYLDKTSDDAQGQINFKLHDFGARGVSSLESSGIGGCAHLVNFMGTDTPQAFRYARKYYGEKMAGFSISASEHSTITSWGKEHEVDAYRNMLKQFAKPGSLVAVVSDSYDIYNAVEKLWGEALHDEVVNSGATLIVRPDSGTPSRVVLKCVQLLDEKFGSTVNKKGYKVLNPCVRVIQGDGINEASIQEILATLEWNGYAADNVAFGMGGELLQTMNRDTQKWAMKCSAIRVNGVWRDVYKDPVTDSGKKSKRGLVTLIKDEDGKFACGLVSTALDMIETDDAMEIVYYSKYGLWSTHANTFEAIRERAASYL